MFETLKDLLAPPITKHRIFFLHIAKCGGTSVANAIAKCYKPWRASNISTVVTLNEEAARFADQHAIADYRHVRRDLLNYLMSIPEIKCLSGHFQYSNVAHDTFLNEWHFVTVLRDPVARWLSHYRYNAARGRITMPIEEFIETEQARSFGRAFVDEITEDLDKSALGTDELTEIAVARYKKFSVIGTIEDTSGFAKRFEDRFGHRLHIPHLNQTPTKQSNCDVPEPVMQRVIDLCAPDIRLHRTLFSS